MENQKPSGAILGTLPAEWEPQSATLLTWPTPSSDWQTDLAAIQVSYLEIVRALYEHQAVFILCANFELQTAIEEQLCQASIPLEKVRFIHILTNDTWIRDYAPIFLTSASGPRALNFQFNAWGEQYPYALDNAVNTQLLNHRGFKHIARVDLDLVLEGGNLESDGQGHLLCNLKCLRKNNIQVIDSHINETNLKAVLSQHIDFKILHCLEIDPLLGDDTGGHIDTLARFIKPGMIAYAHSEDPNDPNRTALDQLCAQLKALKDSSGNPYQLEPIVQPRVLHTNVRGKPLPANYLNFVFVNECVFVPLYNVPQDDKALAKLQALLPKHKIIGIDSRTMIQQLGSLHCSTMQIPKGVIDESRFNTTSL